MARIKYSALVDSIRGSIGGTTFQGNQYGFTVRRKPNMTIPNRKLQNRQKPLIARATRAWRRLSDTERSAWSSFASSNPQPIKNDPAVSMSGYALFVRLNVFRQLSGMSVMEDSPNLTINDTSITLEGIEFGVGEASVEWIATDDYADFEFMLYMTNPLGAGISVIRNQLRLVKTDTGTPGGFSVFDEYEDIFGSNPSVGDLIAAQVVAFDPLNGIRILSDRTIFEVTTP